MITSALASSFVTEGPFAHQLPLDPQTNLVVLAAQALVRDRGLSMPQCHIKLSKGLPAGSGLGSSSASAVAGALAMAAWLDGTPTEGSAFSAWKLAHQGELLDAAGSAEAVAAGAAHLDNVAPCLLGGLQLLTPLGPRRLAWPFAWAIVIASPDQQLTTKAARAALPREVALGVTVQHAQLLATFVHATATGDEALVAACLRDVIAEPYRAALVPGFAQAKAGAFAAGAVACSLSGAGPAVFAVCRPQAADAVADALHAGFAQAAVASTTAICALDAMGARLEAPDAPA